MRNRTTDAIIGTEAQSLAEEVGSYRFCICSVVWYDILAKIHHVSKMLQSVSMQLDVALELLKTAKAPLTSYRGNGFCSAQVSTRELEEMNVETALKQKWLRKTKTVSYSYESPDEPEGDALKQLEMSFFNVVVDVAVASLQERFKTLGDVEEKFGVLVNFPKLQEEELTKQCEALSQTLSCGGRSDPDGRELAKEMQNFPDLPKATTTTLELLTFFV